MTEPVKGAGGGGPSRTGTMAINKDGTWEFTPGRGFAPGETLVFEVSGPGEPDRHVMVFDRPGPLALPEGWGGGDGGPSGSEGGQFSPAISPGLNVRWRDGVDTVEAISPPPIEITDEMVEAGWVELWCHLDADDRDWLWKPRIRAILTAALGRR